MSLSVTSQDNSANALFQEGHVEVDKQRDAKARGPQVADRLRNVDRVNTVHGFDLDNQLPFNEKVNPLCTHERTSIANWYWLLRDV